MDKTREILRELAAWVGRVEALPLIHAAYQRRASVNLPRPLIGLILNDAADIPQWRIGGAQYPLAHGQAALLHTHGGSHSGDVRSGGLWISSFDMAGQDFPVELLDGYGMRGISLRQPAVLRGHFERLVGIFHGPRGATWELHLRAGWLSLIACLLDELATAPNPGAESLPPAVRRALQHMARHYAEPDLTLRSVAAEAGLDPHHFGRVFKASMGQTPMRYLRELRLEQARYLLGTTDLRVGEVALATGFADPLHFSRLFRRAAGLAPRGWRERQRGGPAGQGTD